MKKISQNENGTALPAMMIIIIVMMLLASVLLIYNQKATFSAKREEQSQKAFYVAETGTSNYLFHLNKDPDYYKNNTHPAELAWQDFDQGQYMLSVTPLVNAVGVDIVVTARTPVKTKTKTTYQYKKIKATLQKRSFLKYIYFTDHETTESGTIINFTTGDDIKGALHSNDLITIYWNASPIFREKVTTARTLRRGVQNADFQKGYEENVQPIEMPTTNSKLKTWAQSDGYYYYGLTTIQLNSNGTIDVNNSNVLSTGPTGSALSLPTNGVIYVDGQTSTKYASSNADVFIEGTLNGKLTVASKNDIYITDDILYNNNSADMLGLIADNSVLVNHRNELNQDVAPQNVKIYAAIFTVNGSFGYEKYWLDGLKGELYVYGSIGQRYRGVVGYIGSTGYLKNYNYDPRMQDEEPPHFIEPLNSGFYISSWEELPSRE